jgi:GT2 family glycosyltransferase
MRFHKNSDSQIKVPWYLFGQQRESKVIEQIRDSAFFDHEFYTRSHPDVPGGFDESWNHFLHFGWKELRNPSYYFDVSFYLDQYPDIREAGINPLVHWFVHGRVEKRVPFDPYRSLQIRTKTEVSGSESLRKKIAVCIPVFNSFDLTVRCFESVVETIDSSGHDVVVHVHDDCSSDTRIKNYFVRNKQHNLKFTRSQQNLGFTKSANLLMSSHPDRDVVMLNSDTVVFPNWLNNLARAAYAHERISSVTAMSNNATIASFPNWPVGQQISKGEASLISSFLTNNNAIERFGLHVIPTAVGSCMYLRRDAIDDVGLFDSVKFPRGYGEENQWSMRCQRRGWVNALTFDTYVLHEGGSSFGEQSNLLQKSGTYAILEEFPDYQEGITRWVQNSSVPEIIRNSKFLSSKLPKTASSVHLMHSFGGGTEKLVRAVAQSESKKFSSNALLLQRLDDSYLVSSVGDFSDPIPPVLGLRIELNDLVELLEKVNVSSNEIVVHDPNVIEIDAVRNLRASGRIVKLNLHDYRSVCQRGFKVLPCGLPCLGPGIEICDRCLSSSSFETNSHLAQLDDGFEWFIKQNSKTVNEYDSVEAPSVTAAIELGAHLGVQIGVFRMPEDLDGKVTVGFTPNVQPQLSKKHSSIRVAIVGNLGPHKGTQILSDLVDYAYVNYPEYVFYLVGKWDDVIPQPVMLMNMGGYSDRRELKSIINQIESDIFLIASPAAETFCLTLSDVLEVRDNDKCVVLPKGNIWNERMNGLDRYVQFDVLSGVEGILKALSEASQRQVEGKV